MSASTDTLPLIALAAPRGFVPNAHFTNDPVDITLWHVVGKRSAARIVDAATL